MERNSSNLGRDLSRLTTAQALAMGATRLEALLESTQLLHSSQDLDELLRHLLRTVMGRLLAGRGFIAIEEESVMRLALVRGMRKLALGDRLDPEAARALGVESVYPIGDPAKPIGLLGVAQPPGREIDPREQEFVMALLGIAASGITKARAHAETGRLNRMLAQNVQDLRALLDLARGLSGYLDPEQVAQLLGLTLAGRWAVRKYAIAAWHDSHPLVLRQKGMSLPELGKFREALVELPEAGAVDDLAPGDLKEALQAQQAVLVFPLRSKERTIGVVVIGSRPGKHSYSEEDLNFGAGIAAQAVIAFENAWYFRETVEKKRMEEELALAASIQERLFPEELPVLVGCQLAGHNRPALECGGDYYDVLPISEEGQRQPYLLCVADVSGKGLPASILMSNLQATLRASLKYRPSLVELADHTSQLLYATTPSNKYITAILIYFDPVTGTGRFVNAGHNGAIVMRADGKAEILKPTGAPLGLLPPVIPYLDERIELHSGDILALYSDGVPEAYDLDEEEWGDERLLNCLTPCRHLSAAEITKKMFEGVDAFVGAAPPHDDITVLVLKRTGGGS